MDDGGYPKPLVSLLVLKNLGRNIVTIITTATTLSMPVHTILVITLPIHHLFLLRVLPPCQDLDALQSRITARSLRNHISVFIHELEVILRQEMRNSRGLRPVTRGTVVEFEEGDGEEFHVLGDAEDFCVGT